MISKKFEDNIKQLIKILKKEKLSSIKVSNKDGSIEVSNNDFNQTNKNIETNISENISVQKQVLNQTDSNVETINSPMVGIVYLSPKPSSPVFIKKGQKIKKGATICLIEAMKTFNEIKSDKDGTVSNVLVKNGEPVEFGQQLIELK
ncbi:acetyl-CoA carboxylase biotin carboxyl carrier protein subunit [Alphaproteobacteria bacterium]|nr:acetyl-CoA carboxylase biotin carboxyl carrier protein subunit [Alphaproteobacteria bacterium]